MHFSILFLIICSFNVVLTATVARGNCAEENPFTPKGYVIHYWKKQIANNLPKPSFLLDKASPLTAADYAIFSKLADDQNSLSTHLPGFCTKANLLCFPDLSPSLEKHREDVNFAEYISRNFTNYGTDRPSGIDSFKNYSNGDNIVSDNFIRYNRDSAGHEEEFTGYASDVNLPDQSFNGYGTTATGGKGQFSNYNSEVNVPNLRFTAYSDNSSGRKEIFTEYTNSANSGEEKFTSYGKKGNGTDNEFATYGKDSNVMRSNFKNYGETRNDGGGDTFTSYGEESNVLENIFNHYGAEGNGAIESFKSYRKDTNVGDDDFQSYGKKSNAAQMDFENYGQDFNGGTSRFTAYAKDASGQTVDFKVYRANTTFKDYAKEGVTFSSYTNESTSTAAASSAIKGKTGNKWAVDPGKFFLEKMLKNGTIMPMPDIRDKVPKRSFLPRVIASKLPFSTSKLSELKKIFRATDDSIMAKMLSNSLSECERAPNAGETKRCVTSIEDMIDFAIAVLGRNAAVRTTGNTQGSNSNIRIGEVKGIDGGNVTKSVSCHQSLFPYLLYYCHSVPKVRVYVADILDPKSNAKINHGVAICHLDTSFWSPGHGAFIALGSGPGKIEVCHWIFENDMTWTVAD